MNPSAFLLVLAKKLITHKVIEEVTEKLVNGEPNGERELTQTLVLDKKKALIRGGALTLSGLLSVLYGLGYIDHDTLGILLNFISSGSESL